VNISCIPAWISLYSRDFFRCECLGHTTHERGGEADLHHFPLTLFSHKNAAHGIVAVLAWV
jgi:hypothetical protein